MTCIYIFGPFNSGTNLVSNIIDKCQCINKITLLPIVNNTDNDDSNIKNKNKNNNNNNGRIIIWKHTINVSNIKKILADKNNIVIFMYKNIYNWIYSINKTPYDITFKNIDKHEKLNNNVVLKKLTYNHNHTFGNIVHLYNLYYSNYISILNQHPTNAIFLDYYKVIDKTTSYEYINTQLNKINITILNQQQLIHNLDSPGKPHGLPVKNSQEALSKYDHITNIIKQYLLDKTKIHKYINNNIINYFEN